MYKCLAMTSISLIDTPSFWRTGNDVLRFIDFEIEHIIPRSLSDNRAEWQRVVREWGLPADFEVESDLNRMAACGGCNRRKAGELLPNVGMLLKLAEKRAPKVRELREEKLTDRKHQKLLAEVKRGLDQGIQFRQDIYSLLDPDLPVALPTAPSGWISKGTRACQARPRGGIRQSAGLAPDYGRAVVRSPRIGRYRPSSFKR